MQRIKVIQIATGAVGTHSLRTILGRRDMDLVGLLVYSPDKVGRDAGEFVGTAPTGIAATDDFAEILAMEADVVAYNALGETHDPEAAVDQICQLLESGKNVCSTASSAHVYPQVVTDTPLRERFETACQAGQVTFHSTGVNPGFMMDVLPISLCRLAGRIDTIFTTELDDLSRYTSENIASYMGFGQSPDQANFDLPKEFVEQSGLFATLRMFADATGLEFDDVTVERQAAPSEQRIVTPILTVEPGQVGATRMFLRATKNGKLRLQNQWVWCLGPGSLPPDWEYGDGVWKVRIEGDPTIDVQLDASTTHNAKQSDVLMVATHAVNAIPSVVAAKPGVHTSLDLPLFSGGFFTQD